MLPKSLSNKKGNGPSWLFPDIRTNYELYLLSLPAFLYFAVFHYGPLYGIQIAFKNYIPTKGFLGSPWVGFDQFIRFFHSYNCWTLIENTLGISLYHLAIGFPLPIVLAIMVNEVRHTRFKNFVQIVIYAPHFISLVVLAGMILLFLSPNTGIVNHGLTALGMKQIAFLEQPEWFKTIYVLSGVWQNVGWSSIIYIAVLAGVDSQLYEAAYMDGASKLQRIWNIDLPRILPTAVILFILEAGKLMSVGFEKVFLLQNPLNISASDVISTYVYRMGIGSADFSFATAVGLFNSVVNFVLLLLVNRLARKRSETSLW